MQHRRYSKDGSLNLSSAAFTVLELAIVLCIVILLALGLLAALRTSEKKASPIRCVNNLKQIGTAYRMFSGDMPGKYPTDLATTEGGWHDLLLTWNAGQYCWTNYFIIQNQLGPFPKVLRCPEDAREPAPDFNHLQNANISYFVGVGANENFPMSIFAGDRNLASGTTPKNDYGFSTINGQGNDVILQTNSPVCWSLTMHSKGNAIGAGNILMGDGSVQQCRSARLMSDYTAYAATPSNFPVGFDNSKSNSFRLIFP